MLTNFLNNTKEESGKMKKRNLYIGIVAIVAFLGYFAHLDTQGLITFSIVLAIVWAVASVIAIVCNIAKLKKWHQPIVYKLCSWLEKAEYAVLITIGAVLVYVTVYAVSYCRCIEFVLKNTTSVEQSMILTALFAVYIISLAIETKAKKT